MSEELRKPPVLDFEALLRPIDGDNPSGENLRYSGIYDEISEARRADMDVSQGDWQAELKLPDYNRVIDLAVPALETRSKDLQIAVWLVEALIQKYGFVGLRDGLRLISSLESEFWETLYPEIDEGDMEGRANAISWIELHGSRALGRAPITDGPAYGYLDYEDARRFDVPGDIDSLEAEARQRLDEIMAEAEAQNRVTGEKWRIAKGQTRRKFYEELNFLLSECWDEIKTLDQTNEQKYDRNQMPGLTNLQKALDAIQSQVKKLLDEKRLEEPDTSDAAYDDAATNGDGGAAETRSAAGGTLAGRADALRRLAEIAAFFQRTEPHSPVAYLVNRAVKWGNMPLDSWLRDVIKDENVLFQLRETLGIDASETEY